MKADDLEVGQWVAVAHSVDTIYNPFGGSMEIVDSLVDGEPLKILAISLPWVCVTDGVHRRSLDTRYCTLVRLQRSYVKKMTENRVIQQTLNGTIVARVGIAPDPSQKRNARCCPVCEGPLKNRLIKPGEGVWALVCDECGFIGNIPPAGSET